VGIMATKNVQVNYGTYVAKTVTNLQSLASSATAGWQSIALVTRLLTLFGNQIELAT
jgi:hypothetical protein